MKKISPWAAAMMLGLFAQPLRACGPFFPNTLLEDVAQGVLAAPIANFENELARMKLTTPLRAVPATNGFPQQALERELGDLEKRLAQANMPGAEHERILAAHRANREKLAQFQEQLGAAAEKIRESARWGASLDSGAVKSPALPTFTEVPGLPDEFANYFAGAKLERNPDLDAATKRTPWEQLLEFPAAERHYKSTWAAYMLGRSWAADTNAEPARAIGYFQQVRALAKAGFADSLGLAVASLGAEAQVHYQRQEFLRAMELYLQQFAAGDPTALVSLRWTAARALANDGAGVNSLVEFARHPQAQRVLTAYLVSRDLDSPHFWEPVANPDMPQTESSVVRWLQAVESARVSDVESGELLALAAYRSGDVALAQRWLARARTTPVTEWLQSKLLLRAGKVAEAAALLTKLTRSFPLNPPGTNRPTRLAENLTTVVNPVYGDSIGAGQQLLGELGVLRLARREFVQSLDALLRSGYWEDAAYVAERVLTADELKNYVTANWPEQTDAAGGSEHFDPHACEPRESIRSLLARRLARLNQLGEAREFFPPQSRPHIDALVTELQAAQNQSLSAEVRARAFFAAARMTRANGMELFGTELYPDAAVHGGSFQLSDPACGVRTNGNFAALAASPEEQERARQSRCEPDERYHYRFRAAALAWEAAKLLPDNSDATAQILCTGGSWIKYLNPKAADVFYKALVRRCRQTVLGAQADRMRWFPVLDENGNPKPWSPRVETNNPPALEVLPESPGIAPDAVENPPIVLPDAASGQ